MPRPFSLPPLGLSSSVPGTRSHPFLSSSAHNSGPSPMRVTVKTSRLLSLILEAVVANRGLVFAIFCLGVLQAVFAKAPFALAYPLIDLLTGQEPGTRFLESIAEFLGLDLGSPEMNSVVAFAILVSLCGVLGAPAIYGVLVLSRYFATKIVVDLRNDVGQHMLRLPLRFFGVRRMGELLSNITNDTTILARSFSLAADHVIVDPLLIMANAAILLWFVPESALVLLVMVPAIAWPIHSMGHRIRSTSSRTLSAMGDATESMSQMLSGIRTVKGFQLEDQRLEDFKETNALYLKRSVRMLRAKALSQSSVHLGYTVAFGVLFLFMAWLVANERYSFTSIAIIIAPLATTYTHVKRLTRAYNTLMESAGALEGIESVLLEIPDPGVDGEGIAVPSLEGRVQLEGVSFAYEDEPVLRDVSFTVEPGQTIAMVGPSGAGKSTTLDLLARFYDPIEGRILIDGQNLADMKLVDYRSHIAIVSQQPFLFNASIRDNILCGRPDASQQEMESAARNAQIHDFIVTLPDGYDSLAGERGCSLSGGQMQRITIARAILRDPRILFLDEATSSLDSESEELIQKALKNLMVGRTSFVIAHRLSTIANADLIVVLDKGRVVEQGTHDELISKSGVYKRMRDLQTT